MVGPRRARGGESVRVEDRAVDLALAAAERRFGIGRSLAAPGWVRERVLAVLGSVAARRDLSLFATAERLSSDRAALEEVVAALRVGETRIYRDPVYWEALTTHLLPRLPQDTPIAGLSAGCSTGEEAYTLGMVLAGAGRRFSVLGVDRSAEAIEAAREGVYSVEAAGQLPPRLASRYGEVKGDTLHIRKEIRDLVHFEVCDLIKVVPRGGFHVIFFKNVLLYLSASAGEAVARRLAAELDPRGLLFPAASEAPRLGGAGLISVRLTSQVTAFRAAAT
jgi:chemotaxis protein methyltransferase CheR